MKIKLSSPSRRGFLEVDLLVGLAILSLAIVPLAFSFASERHLLRVEYAHGVANELIDGEMEILAAGGWKDISDGTQVYAVHSHAAATLPPGHFQLTKTGNHLRLEWDAEPGQGIGVLAREITVK